MALAEIITHADVFNVALEDIAEGFSANRIQFEGRQSARLPTPSRSTPISVLPFIVNIQEL